MATRGWQAVTMADVTRRSLRKGPGVPQERRSKYGAVKTTADGIVFDSAKEARRYEELRLMEKAGEIQGLIVQPPYVLNTIRAGVGTLPIIGMYVADFAYTTKEGDVIEDVKGFRTPLYRWKKKHVEAQYGIQIREV